GRCPGGPRRPELHAHRHAGERRHAQNVARGLAEMGRGPAQDDLRNVIHPAPGRSLRLTGRDAGVGARLTMAALVVALQVLAVAAPLRLDAKEASISGTITLTPELRNK